jgi:hypothetical protein
VFSALGAARDIQKCDFNDLHLLAGIDAVRVQLESNRLINNNAMGHHFALIP